MAARRSGATSPSFEHAQVEGCNPLKPVDSSASHANVPSAPALVLASGSPQRSALLAEAGYSFRVVVPSPQAESGAPSGLAPEALVRLLAVRKDEDVARRLADDGPSGEIVVACDTVAHLDGQILGKPADQDDARRMLQMLRGQVHEVLSGLCVWPLGPGQPRVEVARTRLQMERLSDGQIDEYVASGLWQGKAGGFGLQDRIDWLHIQEGSSSNVIGLPLELLARMLADPAIGSKSPEIPPNPRR